MKKKVAAVVLILVLSVLSGCSNIMGYTSLEGIHWGMKKAKTEKVFNIKSIADQNSTNLAYVGVDLPTKDKALEGKYDMLIGFGDDDSLNGLVRFYHLDFAKNEMIEKSNAEYEKVIGVMNKIFGERDENSDSERKSELEKADSAKFTADYQDTWIDRATNTVVAVQLYGDQDGLSISIGFEKYK